MDQIERLTRRCERERTARKQAEALLEEKSRALYAMNEDLVKLAANLAEKEEASRSILEATGDGIITLNSEGRIESVNRAAQSILGYDQEQLAGESVDRLFFDGFSSRELGELPQVGGRLEHGLLQEVVGLQSDGSKIPLEIALSYANLNGRLLVIISMREISKRKEAEQERKELEVELRHAQKLESIGQLAAGIAHEINTPIQFVGDNIRFLEEAFQDLHRLLASYQDAASAYCDNPGTDRVFSTVREIAEEIDLEYLQGEIPQAISQSLEGTDRVASIVRAMKEFSHPGEENKSDTDINQAIQSTITVSRNEWKYDAEMLTELDMTLPPIPCLAGEFNQVILNIIVNAAHAIRDTRQDNSHEKGRIRISTERVEDWLKITISDTGTGIPEEIRNKIFDPFFTTKAVGKGTGQGLAIAYTTVVNKLSGRIDVESTPGEGSMFTIHLPVDGHSGGQL